MAEGDILARMMSLDIRTYLPEDILVKVDRMSMLHALEVRPPFLDHELVEFSQTIPVRLKVKGLTTKYLLKEVGLRYLPSEIVHRRKHGFSVPVGRWFRGALGSAYLAMIDGAEDWVGRDAAAGLLREHREGLRDRSHELWLVYVLLFWMARLRSKGARPLSFYDAGTP
jgi:asparagine synthase (glutamine-hydrolysing)